jgi:glutathione S-transferase
MQADTTPYALVGQFDSPFVRRVAITLGLYGMPFEHRNWSVFRDSEKIATYNPMRRVPVLVLPTGEALVESSAIVDYLDEQVSEESVLLPRSGPARRRGLRVCAQAFSLADKGVALVYENVVREAGTQSERWSERCRLQVSDTLLAFENELASIESRWWLGDRVGHPDIALGIVLHFLEQAVPDMLSELSLPALRDNKERCRELRPFVEYDDPLHFPE